MQRRVSQRLAPLFCQQHQRLAASTQRSVTSVRKKLKQAQAAQAAQQVPESTPQLFEHFDTFYKKDYIKTINIPTIAQKKDACFPNEPKIDYRTLTNEDWTYKALRVTELDADLFKNQVESIGFAEQIKKHLRINLNIAYNNNAKYFDSVLLGNFLECGTLEKQPESIQFNALQENDLYTLIMLTPDHPFRLSPQGNFVQWLVTNIPGNNIGKGDTVFNYLPPLPTECAGTFRYVFLLYKQQAALDANELKSLFSKQHFAELQQLRTREQVSTKPGVKKLHNAKALEYALKTNLFKAQRYGYIYEQEYIAEKLFEQENPSLVPQKQQQGPVFLGSDFVPPPPATPATPEQAAAFNARQMFNLTQFVVERGLSSFPVGLSFFRTEFDETVPQRYQQLGIQEPFYIPPDVQRKQTTKVAKPKVHKHATAMLWK